MSKFVEILRKLFFPRFGCLICGRELVHKENALCDDCLENCGEIKGNICLKCGTKLTSPSTICDECRQVKYEYDEARAVFEYNDYSSRLVLGLKYKNHKYVVPYLGKKLYDCLKAWGIKVDFIVPIPLTVKREKLRGFNQSVLLANELSNWLKSINIVRSDLIKREKDTKPQASLKFKDRKTNIVGIFKANKQAVDVKGKNILIVDDVLTTGSTCGEVAKELKKLKPNKIYVLTVAKTIFDTSNA